MTTVSASLRRLGFAQFPGKPDGSGREARRWAVAEIRRMDPTPDDDVIFKVENILCELIANVIRYTRSAVAGGVFWIRLLGDERCIRVEVIDQGSETDVPHLIESDDDGTGIAYRTVRGEVLTSGEFGRGLMTVKRLSDAMGTRTSTNGRRLVWAEVGW